MDLLADKMSQPVGEVGAIAGGLNHAAGGGIHLAQGYAGFQHSLSRISRLLDQLIHLAMLLAGGCLIEEGAGHVGAVALVFAAHVEENAVPFFQHGVVGEVVSFGGVGSKGHQGGEGTAVGPQLPVDIQHLASHLQL